MVEDQLSKAKLLNRAEREAMLKILMKKIPWQLPGAEPDTCYGRLMFKSQDLKLELYLEKYRNKGCQCFNGFILHVRIYSVLPTKDTYGQSEDFQLEVLQARAFNGYGAYKRWFKRTLDTLMFELHERIENERLNKLKTLIAPAILPVEPPVGHQLELSEDA